MLQPSGASQSVILANYYYGEEIKQEKLGGAYKFKREKKSTERLVQKVLKERDN
jgi:hypothetical protein